ncbi:hypothetical protein [Hyphomonas sp.]|uniref:hypothetical protein n=1 Tax=Hyphomonas sp. TaxID=87 RepID=UPI0030FD1064
MTQEPTAPMTPAYADPVRRTHIKRIKLALFLSALAACLGVSLIGGIGLALFFLVQSFIGFDRVSVFDSSFAGGVMTGLQLSAMNFFLFLITVPAAWAALGLSIGRMPHRGIAARRPYLRWGAIWGAILVGVTTGFFSFMGGGLAMCLGALLAGASVGALAGIGCGFLFYAIVRPAEQLRDVDISVF